MGCGVIERGAGLQPGMLMVYCTLDVLDGVRRSVVFLMVQCTVVYILVFLASIGTASR